MSLTDVFKTSVNPRQAVNALAAQAPELMVGLRSMKGNTWFVNSNASAGGNGASWGGAYTTLAAADAACSADDLILVAPTHAESITAAAGLAFTKAGVSIIGMGNGTRRPTITFTTSASADIDITAANVSLCNFRFITNVASLAAPIDVNAAGFTLEDCDFYGNDAADETNLITIITDAAAVHLTVRRCSFNYLDTVDQTAITTTSTEVIRLVGADFAVIEDNFMIGDFTTSAINGITTASKAVKINRNAIHNVATENIAGAVDLVAACDGVIAYNYGSLLYATNIATVIDPSSCSMIENRFSNVVTEAGGLVGTASA